MKYEDKKHRGPRINNGLVTAAIKIRAKDVYAALDRDLGKEHRVNPFRNYKVKWGSK
jgi:hypothetical protein